jgi:hypothetical protein
MDAAGKDAAARCHRFCVGGIGTANLLKPVEIITAPSGAQ